MRNFLSLHILFFIRGFDKNRDVLFHVGLTAPVIQV